MIKCTDEKISEQNQYNKATIAKIKIYEQFVTFFFDTKEVEKYF